MSIKTKNAGAYADVVGVFHKRAGAYEAVQGVYAKAGGVYGRVDAAPEPATVFASYNDQPSALMGYCSQPSAGRWNMSGAPPSPGAAFAYRIKGSSASMFAFGGDSTPFRVLVDSDTFSNRTIPTLTGGKIPLFSGLADAWHDVMIWQDNSGSGQGFPAPTGNLIEAFGSNAQVLPMGQAWYLGDLSFPGVFAGLTETHSFYPTSQTRKVIGISSQTGWGMSAGSIHMRAKFEKLWVFADKLATHVMVSVNGALATACALSAIDDGTQATTLWRKVDIAAQSSYADIILSGGGREDATAPAAGHIMQGVMVTGTGADVDAPTGTRRHVVLIGASQVEGVSTGARGYRNDCHLVQNRLAIYGTNCGLAGGTITGLTAAVPTIATKVVNKDIAMLSVGINSADDANFQTDYQNLIQACLTAGWAKVVCRGLVTVTSNASKNAKISAAVASFSSAAVVYADVSTWTATTDGAGDTIAMPDGAHPNAAGFAKMADYWVRDHASLFA